MKSNPKISTVDPIRKYKSKFVVEENGVGNIKELSPKIPRTLKKLEPTTFPTAISLFFFIAATTDVANSGNEVPTASIV